MNIPNYSKHNLDIKNKYFIDSNIFVYAYTKIETNKIKKANKIIEKAIKEQNAFISIQTIVEFLNCIYKKIRNIDINIYEKIDSISKTQNILYYNTYTILEAIKIELKYNIHFFDALIVATMLENNITTIYSENEKDFKKIKELKVINPFK